ncbi:MAG: DUF420 domain-containing protein [Planctomycetes bacterium]|nr:DUF420 domain-containing protein [Planctomycetota bacterium]
MKLAYLFPHVNASLNGLSGLLLVLGYWLIRRGRVRAHRNVMLASFSVSILFLISYLTYHFGFKDGVSTSFPKYPPLWARYGYYAILLSHTILASLVPFLALRTIYLGLKDRRSDHRRWARITWPIWLYVSVTGVIVYLLLYHVYPQPTSADKIIVPAASSAEDGENGRTGV